MGDCGENTHYCIKENGTMELTSVRAAQQHCLSLLSLECQDYYQSLAIVVA